MRRGRGSKWGHGRGRGREVAVDEAELDLAEEHRATRAWRSDRSKSFVCRGWGGQEGTNAMSHGCLVEEAIPTAVTTAPQIFHHR
jgi:hypothetical protein